MAIETNRTKQLKALANAFPVANQETANQLQAGRQLQLQQTIGQMQPQVASTIAPAQQIGAQQAQAAGAIQAQQAKDNAAAQTQVGQMGLQEQGRQFREAAQQREITTQRLIQQNMNSLAQLDEKLKNQLLDKQMSFDKDKAGQFIISTQQMEDYNMLHAKSVEEFNNKNQIMNQANQRKAQLLDREYKLIEQALVNEQKREESKNKHEQIKILTEARNNKLRQIEAQKAKQASRMARNKAIGGMGFAVIAAAAAPFTGGASLLAVPAAYSMGEGVATLGTAKGVF